MCAGGRQEGIVKEFIAKVEDPASAMHIAPIADSLSEDVAITMTLDINGPRRARWRRRQRKPESLP